MFHFGIYRISGTTTVHQGSSNSDAGATCIEFIILTLAVLIQWDTYPLAIYSISIIIRVLLPFKLTPQSSKMSSFHAVSFNSIHMRFTSYLFNYSWALYRYYRISFRQSHNLCNSLAKSYFITCLKKEFNVLNIQTEDKEKLKYILHDCNFNFIVDIVL